MLGLQYHPATLLALILIVTFSAHIFTNAILKNMKKTNKMKFYISGKIGEKVISKATRRKFAEAEEMLRDMIERGEIGKGMIDLGESCNAGSVKVKYVLKKRPWIITIEARRK